MTEVSNTETATAANPPTSRLTSSCWLVIILSLYVLIVTALFHDTAQSMVSTWLRTDMYAHGFLIPPLCAYLAWRLRGHLSTLSVRPEPRVLVLTLGAGVAWLFANLVDVNVIQELAYIAMLVSGIWAIVGTAVARRFAFPLGFLFLSVPMGSGLIPPLMEFTADTTESLLRASGIPVLREGMFMYLPTGTWSIVEACSGVNYVIASVTLGLCYAHLNYTSLWRQSAFILAAIVTPVLANSARAYFVVLAGHLSDMRLGTGEDHIVFGWVFFGAVMMLMFWIGSYWQQPEAVPPPPDRSASELPVNALAKVCGITLVCAALWPALSAAMNRGGGPIEIVTLEPPTAQPDWHYADDSDWQWQPFQSGADQELDRVYVKQTNIETLAVGLHLRQYLQQGQGSELIDSSLIPWRPESGDWEVVNLQNVVTDLAVPDHATEARLVSGRVELLVWSWYRIDQRHITNLYVAKLLEAKQQLLQGQRRGARIFISTPLNGDTLQARQSLRDFIADHLTAIENSLDLGISQPLNLTAISLEEPASPKGDR
ncbi:MAG: exosortase A [Gammaproteobacteria bacterium]|nr:exosortase A [Pseudomonadales bacterium]MCP5346799.1 exosortase A [Pseudomonadales bacterium]